MPAQPRALDIAGWVLTVLVALFLLRDASYALPPATLAVAADAALGLPARLVPIIGLGAAGCAVLYAWPRTAMLGAILMTGFLGGAVLTHLRIGTDPWDIGENVLIGIVAWAGLWLREPGLRALMPLKRRPPASR